MGREAGGNLGAGAFYRQNNLPTPLSQPCEPCRVHPVSAKSASRACRLGPGSLPPSPKCIALGAFPRTFVHASAPKVHRAPSHAKCIAHLAPRTYFRTYWQCGSRYWALEHFAKRAGVPGPARRHWFAWLVQSQSCYWATFTFLYTRPAMRCLIGSSTTQRHAART